MPDRRRFLAGATLAGVALSAARPLLAGAPAWPTKPVRIIVPFTPGGSTDIAARLVAASMGTTLARPFVVENRAGAGGNIGLEALARADNDGYTLGIVTTAHAINTTLFERPGYTLPEDIAPIALIQEGPIVLVANPGAGLASTADVIAFAKANPGVLNYATSGVGNSTHMAGELFAMMAEVDLTHVPYQGSAPAIADTMAGVCQLSFDTMLSALPHVQGGKLKALAVTGRERSALLPDVPTVEEAGLQGYEVLAWNGLAAPASAPESVIATANEHANRALGTDEVIQRFDKLGTSVRPTTPDEFRTFIDAEVRKWENVLRATGTQVL